MRLEPISKIPIGGNGTQKELIGQSKAEAASVACSLRRNGYDFKIFLTAAEHMARPKEPVTPTKLPFSVHLGVSGLKRAG